MTFLREMGPRPSPLHVLVRRNSRKPFAATNCAWECGRPRRGVPRRLLKIGVEVLSLRRAALAHGIGYATLCKRLARGWPVLRALGLEMV